MLVFRARGQTHVPQAELFRRVEFFAQRRWGDLLAEAARAGAALEPRNSHALCNADTEANVRRRAERAAPLAHLGELSAASSALEAAPLAPANADTLAELRDPGKRPKHVKCRCRPDWRSSSPQPRWRLTLQNFEPTCFVRGGALPPVRQSRHANT